MQVGDLIRVGPCFPEYDGSVSCECFFCMNKSNRLGVVYEDATDYDSPDGFATGWWVLFDCGIWEVFQSDLKSGEVKVISEGR